MNKAKKSITIFVVFVALASFILYASTAVDALTNDKETPPQTMLESSTETKNKIVTHPEVVKTKKSDLEPVPNASEGEPRSAISTDPADCKNLPLNREKYSLGELSALKDKCKISGY